ncbi:MAG: AtpZ/AtpI family protein [Planctomycetaceae bacterium]
MVVAMQWVHRITGVSLQMVLPAALGYWLDGRWETEPWLLAIGAVLGFIVAMRQLLLWANKENRRSGSQGSGSADNRSEK